MKRLTPVLPLLALAVSSSLAQDPATNETGVSIAPTQISDAFTIKDAIDCVVRYETPYAGLRGSPEVLFYSIARRQDCDDMFWLIRYSARRNDEWPDVELRIRPTGEIEADVCENELDGHLFVPSLLHYCESAGIGLETVTGFLPTRDERSEDSSDEPPEPPEPPAVIYTDEEHVDQFPDKAYGIVCWTNEPVRVTDSLLFETETNRFATLIAAADRIVVRKGGYICHSKNVDEQPIAATITNAAEIAAFNRSIRFYRNYPGLADWCCGYPGIDWWAGDRRIVLSSVQHGRALRWKGFSGDIPFVKESSEKLRAWLKDHGIDDH